MGVHHKTSHILVKRVVAHATRGNQHRIARFAKSHGFQGMPMRRAFLDARSHAKGLEGPITPDGPRKRSSPV